MLAQSSVYVWAIFGGIFYSLCFPQYDLVPLSLLFLPCVVQSIDKATTVRQVLLCALIHSTLVACIGFHWLVYLGQNFGDLNLVESLGLLGLYCLASSPHMILFYVLGFRWKTKLRALNPNLRPLVWAGLFTVLEFSARYLKVFPENLGNTLIAYLPLAQAAALGGVALLSLLPVWLGCSLWEIRLSGMRAKYSAIAALVVIVALFFWGQKEIRYWEQVPPKTVLRIGIVQHNMEEVEKMVLATGAREALRKIVYELLDLTQELVKQNPKMDLVIWPETAYPIHFPGKDTPNQEIYTFGYANLIKDKVREFGVPLLFGAYENNGTKDFNTAFYLNKNGELLDAYRKYTLLFGGEYLPFTDEFPILKQINPQMGGFGRGRGPYPLAYHDPAKQIQLGVNICYEEIIADYMRKLVLNGANVFINITKDSWYGDTFEPWQHFQLSLFRAIEHRVPFIRVTNTGLSGQVFPTGKTQLLSKPFQRVTAVIDVPIPGQHSPTLYTQWGEWLVCLLALYLAGIFVYLQRKL